MYASWSQFFLKYQMYISIFLKIKRNYQQIYCYLIISSCQISISLALGISELFTGQSSQLPHCTPKYATSMEIKTSHPNCDG